MADRSPLGHLPIQIRRLLRIGRVRHVDLYAGRGREKREALRQLCPMCNRPPDRPATMLDDAYSVFECPHPFHSSVETDESRHACEEG